MRHLLSAKAARRARVTVAALAAQLILTASVSASEAGEPKPEPKPVAQPVSVDLARLDVELDLFTAEARRTRLATTLTGLGIGGAVIPAGLVLLGRTDGVSQALVIGMIVGGSAQVLSVPFSYLPTRMDDLREELKDLESKADPKATIALIETKWRAAAEAGRSRRTYVGATLSTIGVLSLGGGLTFLLASEGILGMTRKTQYTLGGVMMGTGIPVTTQGIRMLLEWSLEETAWEAYRSMSSPGSLAKTAASASFAMVPTQGGVLGFATVAF